MKKFKFGLVAFVLLLAFPAYSQSGLPQWNGYIQTRFSSDLDKSSEFNIRRAKIWIYGDIPKVDFISYKVQLIYRSYKDEALMLQDAYADVRIKSYGKFRVGRFVPDFMLQRMQPDYEIPVLERALVVNSLIHNEKQMARETGLSYLFQSETLPMHFSLGVFNANVDKPTHSKDHFLLYTSRLNYKIINQNNVWLSFGGSLAYRQLDKSTLTTIYKADSLISGRDFRYGIEAQLHWNKLELQGEYIQAQINKEKASGYYALADYTISKKYQAVALTEKYNDLNPATDDHAWYGMGLNYQISGKTKLMTDIKAQKAATKTNYLGEIQLQVFFN